MAERSRAYTQAQSLPGQSVVCLDAATVTTVWERRVDSAWQPAGAYPGTYATPTVAAGRVYYASPHGVVGCLDAGTGAAVWSRDVVRDFRGRGCPFGYACTPMVEGGKVIFHVGGEFAAVVALDAGDGKFVWRASGGPASYAPALPVTAGGRRQVVAFLQNARVGMDTSEGAVLWREEFSSSYDEHSACPLFADGVLVAAAPFRSGARAFRFGAGGRPAPAWVSAAYSADVVSGVAVGGHVYGFDLAELQAKVHRPSRGRFKCLEIATGRVCRENDGTGHVTALAADGKLILLNDRGTLLLARATPAGYEELSRRQMFAGGPCWTQPTLSEGRLYLRNGNDAICLYLRDPDRLRAGERAEGVRLPAAPAFDWVWLLGPEPDYPIDAPTVRELTCWFAACVAAVFAPAVLLAVVARIALYRLRPPSALPAARGAYLLAALASAVAATPLLGERLGRFVFAAPAGLYAAFQATMLAGAAAGRPTASHGARWAARGPCWALWGSVQATMPPAVPSG